MATKTKNIADLSSISANSASLLGKTPSNSVGYIAGLLDAQGNIAGLSDLKDQISQLESLKTELQNLTQNITELQETVGGLESDTSLEDHTSNTDIHVTAEDKNKWNEKIDESKLQEELESAKQEIKDEVQGELDAHAASAMHYKGQVATEGELPGADQQLGDVYNVEETGANYAWNGTSWDKFSEDISELATKTEVEELSGRVDTLEAIEVDQTYNAESENAQAGKAVAEAIDQQRTIQNAGNTAYMSNETTGGLIKFIKANGEGGKVTTYDGSDSEGTYVQISTFNQDKSKVAKMNFTLTGAYYSKESSGAVAVSDNELVVKKDIKSLASTEYVDEQVRATSAHFRGSWPTKADIPSTVDDYPQDINGSKTPEKNDYLVVLQDETHEGHTWEYRYTGVWDTNGVDGWTAAFEISASPLTEAQIAALNSGITAELVGQIGQKANQSDLDTLDGRVDALEAITVDQTYNGESTNAQSGTAVAEAIKDLATKTEVAEKADQSALQSLTERVETVEAVEVDQTYNSKSTNAQSGTAVAEAIQNEKVINFGGHTAYMANETSGGLIKFTKNTGEIAKITTFDGSDGEQTFIQLVTQNGDKSKTAKINFTLDGAFYSKMTGEAVAVADNELVVKKDIKDLSTSADLTAHTGNADIHVTAEDKTKWNAKVDESKLQEELGAAKQEVEEKLQGEITAKLEAAMHYKGQVATEGELPEADQQLGDIYNVEETGANYAWNGTSWDKLSEDLSGFATKTEMEAQLALKGDKVDYDQMKEFYEHVQQDLAGHMANSNVHFDAGEKETWQTQLDGLKDLDSKYALRSELAGKTDLTTYNELEARVDILEAVPKITVDQVWDQYSENPQSGIAIQSALDNYVTDEDLSVEMLKKANKGDFDALDDRVETLESKPDPVVDQMFLKDSHNAQSGTAVDNAISTLATKEQFNAHADNTDIHVTAEDKEKWNDTYSKSDIDSKVEEKANASELPKYVQKNVTGEAGVVLTQIYAHDLEDTTSSRLNVHIDGIYYTKNAESDEVTADNEILTKADIKDLVANSTVTDLSDRVAALEGVTIDQTYDAESTNAQSGTAVAEAVAPIATKADASELTAHTSNSDIHVTAANKAAWDAKASEEKLESLKTEMLSEISSKIKGVMHYKGQVANKEALPIIDQVEGDLYDVGDTGANYIWTGAAWDKLSEDAAGTEALQEHIADTDVHVTADLKSKLTDLYTKAEIDAKLAEKGSQLDYESIKTLTDTITNELDTHETDDTRHFAVDEKTAWEAKLNKIAELEAKITQLEEKITALQGS